MPRKQRATWLSLWDEIREGGGDREREGRRVTEEGRRESQDWRLQTRDCRAEIGEFGDTNPIPRLDVALNQVVQLLSRLPEPLPLSLSVCLSTPLIFITRSIDSSPCPPAPFCQSRPNPTLCSKSSLVFPHFPLSLSLSLTCLVF